MINQANGRTNEGKADAVPVARPEICLVRTEATVSKPELSRETCEQTMLSVYTHTCGNSDQRTVNEHQDWCRVSKMHSSRKPSECDDGAKEVVSVPNRTLEVTIDQNFTCGVVSK